MSFCLCCGHKSIAIGPLNSEPIPMGQRCGSFDKQFICSVLDEFQLVSVVDTTLGNSSRPVSWSRRSRRCKTYCSSRPAPPSVRSPSGRSAGGCSPAPARTPRISDRIHPNSHPTLCKAKRCVEYDDEVMNTHPNAPKYTTQAHTQEYRQGKSTAYPYILRRTQLP